jgi:hypothetical protein
MNRIDPNLAERALGVPIPEPASAPTVPDWLKLATLTLRTKFAAPSDGRGEWTTPDTIAYGRVLSPLGPERCDAVIQLCRERFVWRPTVAEVVGIIDEVAGRSREAISGADAAARTVVTRPLALPSTGENAARTALREKMRRLRGELGQTDLRVVDGGQASEVAA